VDKKTLPIIIVLALLVMFYWQILQFFGLTPASDQQPAQQIPDTNSQSVTPTDTASTFGRADISQTDSLQPTPVDSLQQPTEQTETDSVVINTNKYTATLSTKGGGLVSLLLKEHTYRDRSPVEMIPQTDGGVPEARFANGTVATSDLSFQSSREPRSYDVSGQSFSLAYTYTSPSGGKITKTYTFYPDEYHIDLALQITNREQLGFEQQYSINWNSPIGITEPDKKFDHEAIEAVAMQSGSRVKLDDFQNNTLNQSLTGYTSWAGVRSKYFAAIIIPKNKVADAAMAQGEIRNVPSEGDVLQEKYLTAGMELPIEAGSSFTDSFTVFAGPLDYTLMSSYDVQLEDMLDIGTTPYIGWIIKPFALAIIWLLPKMYSFIGNYGVVIILFALLVKLVTLPLSLKSFKSMNAMKELGPKLEQLKAKHKNNPQALNAEMMKLYKDNGVNPFSGCLPMLMQMPLFFALFSVFRSTILLRDAPFIGFINDLSHGASSFTDPYIILVVLMIAAQFVSQYLTTAQTQQNKMLLYAMPLVMGFIFHSFAAGLVLYWTVFSLFSLIDYALFKRGSKNAQIKTA